MAIGQQIDGKCIPLSPLVMRDGIPEWSVIEQLIQRVAATIAVGRFAIEYG